MKLGLRNAIGVRLLRIVFGCYLVITVIVTATQLYFEFANVEKDVVTELYNVGRSFEDGLGAAIWSLDEETIKSIITGVQKIEAVAAVRVLNQHGGLEGATGIFQDKVLEKKQTGVIRSDGVEAKEVHIVTDDENQLYYEYEIEVYYDEFEEDQPELIGFVYVYAAKNTVVKRFKNSLFLILVNAIIKTAALWVIFLYFSKRLLSKPLSDLTSATAALSQGGLQSEALSKRLQEMADSVNKNELQQLASSFVSMRESILEKIDNLNALNHFAVVLTQVNQREKIYEHLFHLLSKMFGAKSAVVIGENDNVLWKTDSTFESDSGINIDDNGQFHHYDLDLLRGSNEIAYHVSHREKDEAEKKAIPLLFLPINFGNNEKNEMWLLGELKPSRLNESQQLNSESHSFLQVIRNMVVATITGIAQGQIIKDQNRNLEQRVHDRTEELASANKELRHMAVHDPLTELPNRTLFNDRLNHTINMAIRDNSHFAVASIDLTEFKQINDNYGHDAGDTVLVEVGQRLSSSLRKSDTLARMGGDEFAAILAGGNIENSLDQILGRLNSALQDAVLLSNGECVLAGANIGVAMFPEHATDAEVLFKYADIAMYQAKRSGKGYSVFDKEKNSREREYLQFIYELEHAIERDQLRLHYQPIVDLTTGKPVSVEALLRWEHHERGMVPPGEFIPHAERTALIKPITFWVVKEACQQCVQWHKRGIKTAVSVNISARIFTSPDLAEELLEILSVSDLEPRWLKLEITESTAMSNPEKALGIIAAFREKGFILSIDDFGTGHSSLSYLTKLPINELKIDRSFLASKDENSQIIVQTVIDLAHTLKLYVVAEGIEDAETIEILKKKGCDAVQGYHICRPADAVRIEQWYKDCEDRGTYLN